MRQPTGATPAAPDRVPLYVRSAGDVVLIEIFAVGSAPRDRQPIRLAVTGTLDRRTAADLRDTLAGLVRRYRPGRVELDLSGVTYQDDAGARGVQRFAAVAGRLDTAVAVLDPPSPRRPPNRFRTGRRRDAVRVAHRTTAPSTVAASGRNPACPP